MATKKVYKDADYYEKKLDRIMECFGVEKYNWDFTRHECWVEFTYKGQLYKFQHGVQQARDAGFNLQYGSDAFAQLVLALEDLARVVERGIYDLSYWIDGMRALPAGPSIPKCFITLGFTDYPQNEEEVKKAYRELAKIKHPDQGGTGAEFRELSDAYEEALREIKRSRD